MTLALSACSLPRANAAKTAALFKTIRPCPFRCSARKWRGTMLARIAPRDSTRRMLMLNFVALLLVGAALAVLVTALVPTRRLLAELPAGPLHTQCRVLAALIVLFILGYLIYLGALWDRHQSPLDLVVPALLVCG